MAPFLILVYPISNNNSNKYFFIIIIISWNHNFFFPSCNILCQILCILSITKNSQLEHGESRKREFKIVYIEIMHDKKKEKLFCGREFLGFWIGDFVSCIIFLYYLEGNQKRGGGLITTFF